MTMSKLFLCVALYKQKVFDAHSSEPKSRNLNASESALKILVLEVFHLKYSISDPSLVINDFKIRPHSFLYFKIC